MLLRRKIAKIFSVKGNTSITTLHGLLHQLSYYGICDYSLSASIDESKFVIYYPLFDETEEIAGIQSRGNVQETLEDPRGEQ